jgi:hypothetical protein
MINEMLVVDVEQRSTAAALLQHEWLTTDSNALPSATLGVHVVHRLRAFASMSHMKRLSLVVLAKNVTHREVNRLRVGGQQQALSCKRCPASDVLRAMSCKHCPTYPISVKIADAEVVDEVAAVVSHPVS